MASLVGRIIITHDTNKTYANFFLSVGRGPDFATELSDARPQLLSIATGSLILILYAINLRHADIICTMHYALVMHFACSNEYLAQNTEP